MRAIGKRIVLGARISRWLYRALSFAKSTRFARIIMRRGDLSRACEGSRQSAGAYNKTARTRFLIRQPETRFLDKKTREFAPLLSFFFLFTGISISRTWSVYARSPAVLAQRSQRSRAFYPTTIINDDSMESRAHRRVIYTSEIRANNRLASETRIRELPANYIDLDSVRVGENLSRALPP